MTSKHKSEDYKKSAVEYYLVGDKSQLEVCEIFKCNPRSLMRWVEKYEKEGEIKRENREPIAYKVHKEHVKFLLGEIKKNKTITMTELKHKLKDNFKIELSRFHINRIVNDNNITLKITRIRHEPIKRFGKDIEINKKLKEFYDEINKYKLEDIICIDETSISGLQKRHHCYSELGKRCIIKTHSQEVFKKYTGIFAISYDGVLGWDLYEKGGIDSDRLYDFLEKHITTKYKNKLIILDNASSHRNARIKELVNKHNTLLYSVPYQHFTNSIENYFSMMKSRLQKLDGLTHKELKTNIDKVVKEIPKEKYQNIIKGTYNRSKKFHKEPSNRKKTLKKYL
jgi:transposase